MEDAVAYTFPRWTEEDVKRDMAGDLGRALDSARRTGQTFVFPLAAKGGERRVQAIQAEPDGTWALIPWHTS
jgi:hypothetical protein